MEMLNKQIYTKELYEQWLANVVVVVQMKRMMNEKEKEVAENDRENKQVKMDHQMKKFVYQMMNIQNEMMDHHRQEEKHCYLMDVRMMMMSISVVEKPMEFFHLILTMNWQLEL